MTELKRGSRGASVRRLQAKLGVPVDGIYGPATESAVRGFQARKHLTADGVYGPKTEAALFPRAKTPVGGASTKSATSSPKAAARKPKEDVVANVVNQSSRKGAAIVRIVLHSTESANLAGTADLKGLVSWFNNPRAEASSHLVIDAEGLTARCVPDSEKAWTEAAFNPGSLAIEMVGRAAQTAWPKAQVAEAAKWVAYWADKYDIPLVHSVAHGVCYHSDLGVDGGGHHDPGNAFPLARLLELARAA